jgi:hypothetical protein
VPDTLLSCLEYELRMFTSYIINASSLNHFHLFTNLCPYPWQSLIFSVSVYFPVLDISCKCGSSLLYLASFSWHYVFKVHPCCCLYPYFIHFSDWIIFCWYSLSIHQLTSIWVVPTFWLSDHCHENSWMSFVWTCLQFSWVYT